MQVALSFFQAICNDGCVLMSRVLRPLLSANDQPCAATPHRASLSTGQANGSMCGGASMLRSISMSPEKTLAAAASSLSESIPHL